MEECNGNARTKVFKDLENVAHEKLVKLPRDVAFLFFQKLFGLMTSGERERSWQLFFDWLANKKTAEDIVSELETQDG
jgi:hypothetical protein